MEDTFINKITEVFIKHNIELKKEQKENFYNYYKLLVSWNEKFNLTTIISLEDVVVKHFLDSVIAYKNIKQNSKIIDIGAGAGFPSLPLKIMRPDLTVLMVDSVNKKVTFLQEVIKQLNLDNTTTIHSRVEDLANKKEYREQFDYCVSRAVASLNTLSEYALPFIKLGGEMLAYKANEINEELENSKKAISVLGGKVAEILEFNVEGVNRKVIKILKQSPTPLKYPRSGNKPRLSPIS